MMKYAFVGDSFAHKGFTAENNGQMIRSTDVCLADHWQYPYQKVIAPGRGNLVVLEKLLQSGWDLSKPVVWVYTEPGRDYGRITGRPEHEWIEREDIMTIRKDLDREIMSLIRQSLPDTPIGMIGGLCDVDIILAADNDIDVLHPSWQGWIAGVLGSQWFQHGWGALDIGWRTHADGIKPSAAATFAWDEQIKEWCWWQEKGYFYAEHPTPLANEKFAEFLEPAIANWLGSL